MPSFAVDTFGAKNIGSIYGKLLFAWSVAGVVGPMMMERIVKTTGTFSSALTMAGVLLITGVVLMAFYKRPQRLAIKAKEQEAVAVKACGTN